MAVEVVLEGGGNRSAGCSMLAQVFMAMNACVMFSIAFVFSCLNIKPAAATIVALTILLASLVWEVIPAYDTYENWLVTHHFRCWLLAF